ncbi:MAG TPA: protein kinase [Thermoanaerobaculia bacterium]|nr:protein kinase [Thermoanaerobaculia bacterium]
MTTLPEIESRFEVLAKLGEGGMGTVYKVRHRDLDEEQIVKTLQAHLSSNPALKERFINEARRGMKLRHPHIAGVHDFAVCADGTGYIVMEYVHGHNLRDVLATRGPLRVPLVGAIAVQSLDALAYLHSQRFVHRDISPDNLMMTNVDGQPFIKLIDLGIAKSLEAGNTMTATGQFIGKVSYASPEQFGGHVDARSDLYSLGVVLYKLLTNEDPFSGENYREIISAQLFQPPKPFNPELQIPEAVQRVVLRALEKEPEKRYADAIEFRDAAQEAFGIEDAAPLSVATRPARTQPGASPSLARTESLTTIVPTGAAPTQVAPTVAATIPGDDATIATGEATLIDRPQRKTRKWPIVVPIVALLLAAVLFAVYQRMEAARLASFGKFYAVVIGESAYRKFESLPTTINDARAVAKVLEEDYGFEVTRLENAESRQILAALQATAKQMTKDDNLVVFYAGHGAIKNGKGYWQPVDADFDMSNWISPAILRDVLLDHPARRTLIIADSCFAGALAQGTLSQAEDRDQKRARLVVSSGGNAPIIDSADGQHSMFTRALLDVLANPDEKIIDVQSLFPRIRERVTDAARRAGREQNPELAVMAEVGDEGGSFYFIRK